MIRNYANEWTLKQVLATPVPKATESYVPVSNKFLIGEFQNRLKNKGLAISGERYLSNKYGTEVVGSYKLQNGHEDKDFKLSIVFKNSYNKAVRVTFVTGAEVTVCSNGMIMGDTEIFFVRKHTGTVVEELEEKMELALTNIDKEFERLIKRKELMKSVMVEPLVKAELLGRMFFEEDMLTVTQMSIIKHELEYSDNFKGNTCWDFYNNITEALKQDHPHTYVNRHIAVSSFIEKNVLQLQA
jgi:hypothetical protein